MEQATRAAQTCQEYTWWSLSTASRVAFLTLWCILLVGVVSGCTPTLQVQNTPATAAGETPPEATMMREVPGAETTERALTMFVTYFAFVAEMCGAVVIAVAVIRGFLRYIPHIVGRQGAEETYTEGIRLQLGKSLALALEFELGADILQTAVAPTLAIILQTAAIAALRTFLNYFLDRELREAERRRAGHMQPAPPDP